MPFDVSCANADFVVARRSSGCAEWRAPVCCRFANSLFQECRPELRGWFSQENPFAWALDSFAYARDARRFDHGTPSILAAAACLPALEWHARQDAAGRSQLTTEHWCEAVIEGCAELGSTLVSPASAEERGGSVMFRMPASKDPAAIVARTARAEAVHGLPGKYPAHIPRQRDDRRTVSIDCCRRFMRNSLINIRSRGLWERGRNNNECFSTRLREMVDLRDRSKQSDPAIRPSRQSWHPKRRARERNLFARKDAGN